MLSTARCSFGSGAPSRASGVGTPPRSTERSACTPSAATWLARDMSCALPSTPRGASSTKVTTLQVRRLPLVIGVERLPLRLSAFEGELGPLLQFDSQVGEHCDRLLRRQPCDAAACTSSSAVLDALVAVGGCLLQCLSDLVVQNAASGVVEPCFAPRHHQLQLLIEGVELLGRNRARLYAHAAQLSRAAAPLDEQALDACEARGWRLAQTLSQSQHYLCVKVACFGLYDEADWAKDRLRCHVSIYRSSARLTGRRLGFWAFVRHPPRAAPRMRLSPRTWLCGITEWREAKHGTPLRPGPWPPEHHDEGASPPPSGHAPGHGARVQGPDADEHTARDELGAERPRDGSAAADDEGRGHDS
eukprot:scaffold101990_cov47-Phaeocystis_antarctica.AAC.3